MGALSNFAMGGGVVNNPFSMPAEKTADVVISVEDADSNRTGIYLLN